MAGNRKGTHDIAPIIRAAFVRAVARLEDGGKELADLIEKSLQEDLKGTLTAVAKYTVREAAVTGKVEHEHTHEHSIVGLSETAGFLEAVTGQQEARASKEPVSH